MTEVVERRAARVLVVDPDGQVLMIHGYDPHAPERTYWYTIGGGVDPGEADVDAAVREVWEETGLRVTPEDLVGPVHQDQAEFPFEGRTFVQHQVFFVLATEHYQPRPVALEDTEIRSTVEIGWIDPAAREAAGQQVYPLGLADLIHRVHRTAP
jgi:8-oxo-dGTP pyrophosphatase MutT (NUDIX family)